MPYLNATINFNMLQYISSSASQVTVSHWRFLTNSEKPATSERYLTEY